MDFGTEIQSNETSSVDQIDRNMSNLRIEETNFLLLDIPFINGGAMKNEMEFLSRLHGKTTFEFYKSGIWGIQIKKDPKSVNISRIELVTVVEFPARKLISYNVHHEKLPSYDETKPAKAMFSLKFETAALYQFLKTMKAGNSFAMRYYYGSTTMEIVNLGTKGGFPLPVEFGLTPEIFPISGDICDPNLSPIVNIRCSEFSGNAANLTKVKSQLTYDMFIDLQYNDSTNEGGAFVHSSQAGFRMDHGVYDLRSIPDCSFCIKSDIMKALGIIHKSNDNGFLGLYCVDESVIRISSQIENFGKQDVYIIPKRKATNSKMSQVIC